MIETSFDTQSAKAAIYAVDEYFQRTKKERLPVMISATIVEHEDSFIDLAFELGGVQGLEPHPGAAHRQRHRAHRQGEDHAPSAGRLRRP